MIVNTSSNVSIWRQVHKKTQHACKENILNLHLKHSWSKSVDDIKSYYSHDCLSPVMVLDLWRLLEWAWDPGKAMRWWVSNCGYNSDMEPPDWLTGAGAGDEGEDAPEPESRSRGSSSCMNTSSSSTSLLSWPTAEPGGVTGEERPGEQRWWLNILSSMNESINKILYIFCTLLNRNYCSLSSLPLWWLWESMPCLWGQATVCSVLTRRGSVPIIRYEKTIHDVDIIFLPDKRSSTACWTAAWNARASAAVWKVRPYFMLPVLQWWNVGITRLYWKSRLMVQLITT